MNRQQGEALREASTYLRQCIFAAKRWDWSSSHEWLRRSRMALFEALTDVSLTAEALEQARVLERFIGRAAKILAAAPHETDDAAGTNEQSNVVADAARLLQLAEEALDAGAYNVVRDLSRDLEPLTGQLSDGALEQLVVINNRARRVGRA